ncbi:hypothetical protein NMG60_11001514 [Bertholletia excelsa]
MNHFSSEIPESIWWAAQPPFTQPTTVNTQFDTSSMFAGQEDDDVDYQLADEGRNLALLSDKEAMFEKPLTPSDVGKLNRLVIPKQHAEKYFPLGGGEKTLLLSFEDESGKSWRFRYSYWNSSQSYVLTKGWSRFVKEKRLDAGDIVLFQRHRLHTEKLFIGWRRRSEYEAAAAMEAANCGGGGWIGGFYSGHPYPWHPRGPCMPYQPECLHFAGAGGQNPTVVNGNSKTLRLFGVNMELECQADGSELSTPDSSSVTSQGEAHHSQYHTSALSSDPQSHMVAPPAPLWSMSMR